MNKKALDEVGFEDVRLRHYELMVGLHTARHDALELCRDYREICSTRGLAEDASKWQPALASVAIYIALAPFNNESADLMARVRTDKRLEDAPLAPFKVRKEGKGALARALLGVATPLLSSSLPSPPSLPPPLRRCLTCSPRRS
jgi:hypothetical protein